MSTSQKQLFDFPEPDSAKEFFSELEQGDLCVADIVLNKPLASVFQYVVPDGLRENMEPGKRVAVPFGRGNRQEIGFCVAVHYSHRPKRQLKSIFKIVDERPLVSEKMLTLTRWIADEYLCGWGQVLESVIPRGVKQGAGLRERTYFRIDEAQRELAVLEKLPSKQKQVWEVLSSSEKPLALEEIVEKVGCSAGPIQSLRKKGMIHSFRKIDESERENDQPSERELPDYLLNSDQKKVLKKIVSIVETQQHKTILLRGVTGSGKTEVYIRAIQEVVAYGKQAIVLVPEISLTPQTIRRFRSRLDSVAVLHSHLSDSERHAEWRKIASGSVQVVVGARSAVFAPTKNLGMIVIDEEHETSFKQDTTPRYHTRQVARKRAEIENIPLILGSATPTLESWHRAQQKNDLLLTLPNRVNDLPLPPVILVDVRNDQYITRGSAIGRILATAMRNSLEHGGQIILFLNMRGFSPALWCLACGKSMKCPSCDITLTWHRDRGVALCHVCNFHTNDVRACLECGHQGIRHLGIGTQKLEQEVLARFPNYKCLRMDSDAMRKKGSHDRALEAFRKGEVSILLGTQMIAKGLDFPNVTLVGVINSDWLLNQPDFRASERTFQLIAQVAGRTGRGIKGGRVFVQTMNPTDPSIRFAAEHDFLSFAQHELRYRKEHYSPPFSRIIRIVFRGENEATTRKTAEETSARLKESIAAAFPGLKILGPAPAPISRLKRFYRFHLQLYFPPDVKLQELGSQIREIMQPSKDVDFVIDVDPVDLR